MRNEWPNNEAEKTADQYHYLVEIEGVEYANGWLEKQREYLAHVFGNGDDIAIYNAKVDKLIGVANS
jgi:hypothetical protein